MMTPEELKRISELTRLARERELTAEEQRERERLRAQYIADFRSSLEQKLSHTVLVRPDGTREKLRRKKP